ncbi:hypothetical protein U9J35_01565 [Rossellomorea aquimaris]|nr:hypothetical protein [Rossellomorea aquimaris]WRP06884.1 hypothetical protein U9J35_01565 [Rossellomorea aquimaris]
MNKHYKITNLLKEYKRLFLEKNLKLHKLGVDEFEDEYESEGFLWTEETESMIKIRKRLVREFVDVVHQDNDHEYDFIDHVIFGYEEGDISLKKATDILVNWRLLHKYRIDTTRVVWERGAKHYDYISELIKMNEFKLPNVSNSEELFKEDSN